MLTKFYLHYDDIQYELKDDDLYNWDQIMCSYKRGNYDGVVRSFTSQFVFVNEAREILLSLYLRDRFNAKASISVHTITDRWEWEQKFICPLDFSTTQWEKYTFRINAVDNSLAALIKANKNTKYELSIGSDIRSYDKFRFDRIPMVENLTYEFTQGTSVGDSGDLDVTFERDQLPYIGIVDSEIAINKTIIWNDDQTDESTSYVLEAIKDVKINFFAEFEWWTNQGENLVAIGVFIRRNGVFLQTSSDIQDGNGGYIVNFDSHHYTEHTVSHPTDLPHPDTIEDENKRYNYAIINDEVWSLEYTVRGYQWVNSNKTATEFFQNKSGLITLPLNLKAGDRVVVRHDIKNTLAQSNTIRIVKSKMQFEWMTKGDSEDISVFTPKNVATQLLRKIADGKVNVDVSISNFDSRLARTYIMAAESLRGLKVAKLYSSFSDFCDWMSAVFGYVYYIGDPQSSKYKDIRICGQIEGTPWKYEDEYFDGTVTTDNIIYIPYHARFFYHDPSDDKLYTEWYGWEQYNDPTTGHPRTDTLFIIEEWSDSNLYYFKEYSGRSLQPVLYDHSEDYIGDDGQTVYFVHRSELLNPNSKVKKLLNCRGVKYNVDTSAIYSAITVGYDKKDYDKINGRDEFNFNNTYSTGCTVSDKTLSLISKYRADCYGMEFAVQKRDNDTTDSSSDKDVFFVLCTNINGVLIADRTIPISNSLNGAVFNGAFSPMACIRANAGFIGLQADEMTLKFASSTGNSEIVIDGEPMSADIILDRPLATAGWIEFTTDEVDYITNVEDLVEITDEEGMGYRGFLKEVDVKYAKTEASKFKLIIKDIER